MEGDSSFTTPNIDSVVQFFKCEPTEGDSSKFSLVLSTHTYLYLFPSTVSVGLKGQVVPPQ